VEFRGTPFGVSEADFLSKVPGFACRDAGGQLERESADRICSAEGTREALTYGNRGAKTISAKFVADKLESVNVEFEFASTGSKLSGVNEMLGFSNQLLEIFVSRYGKPEVDPKLRSMGIANWKLPSGRVTLMNMESTISGIPSKLLVLISSPQYDAILRDRRKPGVEERSKGM